MSVNGLKVMALTLATATATAALVSDSTPVVIKAPIVRAAAFDLGSGKTKVTIADVKRDPFGSWQVVETLWKKEEVLKFSDDLAGSKDGNLSSEVQEKGIVLLKKLKLIAEKEHGAQDFCCIATEVFRKAKNGEAFIHRIKEEVRIPVYLVTQDQEATLGFSTGVAIGSLPPEKAMVVDHGSGSFQVSAQNQGTLVSFNGKLGTIPLTQALIEKVQKTPYKPGSAPKPLSETEAQAFIQLVHKELSQVPGWLVQKVSDTESRAVGLAGPAGTFGMCAAVVGKKEFTQEELWLGIQRLLNCSDIQIKQAYPTIYDPTFLPRVLFVYSLMTHLNLNKIAWAESNGCTEGMLITSSFWPSPIRSKL